MPIINEHLNGQDFNYVFAGESLSSGSSRKTINQAKEIEEFKFLKKAASSFLLAITKMNQFIYLFEDPDKALKDYPSAFQEITAYGTLAAEALTEWGMRNVSSSIFVNRLFTSMRFQRTNAKQKISRFYNIKESLYSVLNCILI